MPKRLFVTSPSIWRRFALVAIVFGLLGNTLLFPLPANAATTRLCKDGGDRSIGEANGYKPNSECDFYVTVFGCDWLSDKPRGWYDRLKCDEKVPPERPGYPGNKEQKPESCATHTHRIPADFTGLGLNIHYGWFRVERRVCFNDVKITRLPWQNVYLDLDDPVRVLGILSLKQREYSGYWEYWENHPQGLLNTFWEFSIRLETEEIRIPGFTIPGTNRRVGSFTLPKYNGEIERPAIRIISLANGCYYAAPGGGDDPICPPGSYGFK